MKAVELYKFIEENAIEYRHQENEGKLDVLIWINPFDFEEFNSLFKDSGIMDEGPIECFMTKSQISFWMKDICEYHGIELDEIFKPSKW